jgi:hypothetical protein
MGSGAVIYVPSLIKIGSGVQKLMGGIHRHTHGQQSDLISLLYIFQNKKSRLKIALFGELSLEEAIDLSRDRQILD